ncbi:hypothetical protein K439DRAFT_1343387, partial [Ramaria rubella]
LIVAKNVVINVGGNSTNTYDPQRVVAVSGDTVVFTFIGGNHSATRSDFATPCIPIHYTNNSINGFDSGLRIGINGTGATVLTIPIDDTNNNTAIWFYDSFPGACGAGNVGVINSNETSDNNIAAFVRNAERLNGTTGTSDGDGSSSNFTGLPSNTSPASPVQSGSSSKEGRVIIVPFVNSCVMFVVGFIVLFI